MSAGSAPLKRAPRKPAAKRGARGPAIAELIATRLEEEIVLGRRHPRERLIEQELCDAFHTHRADVRLALFELEKKGIIQRIPNRGAIVRDLTPREVTEIYAVREKLEVMAVRIMPLPVDRRDIEKLEHIQKGHSAAIDKGDLLTVFYRNLNFHRSLYAFAATHASSRRSSNWRRRSTASGPTPTPIPARSIARAATMSP